MKKVTHFVSFNSTPVLTAVVHEQHMESNAEEHLLLNALLTLAYASIFWGSSSDVTIGI